MEMRERLYELLHCNVCECEDCNECAHCDDEDGCISYMEYRMADILIANGVIIPVRCFECKHSKEYKCKVDPMLNHRLCYRDDVTVRFVEDDFFCAYGERKDESE